MIQLPNRLKELLQRSNPLNSLVLGVASIVGPWTKDNKTPLFPEYTDHSLVHLNEVLASAESLISDDSWRLLTSDDAAVLCISVLLHDCAMHLSEDSFLHLVKIGDWPPISRYVRNEAPWAVLWQEFLSEASRFDQRKLVQLFGDADPIGEFPSSKMSLTNRHRLLMGEFVRRHHARLAHEIALIGIPTSTGGRLRISASHAELLDLSGFVARSHNLSLRAAVDALEPSKRRVHLNCRVPFVMAVLRIADYVQVHSARAPQQLLQLKSLASPVSRQEWKKHESIVELHQAHDDPEAIFADAEPKDVATFLSLQSLFKDIQLELDQAWAVLGELYGRLEALRELGITVRRVRSSIDDPDEYVKFKRPGYIPRRFSFGTSNGSLLDLLVVPLYGDRPEVGIRELVQNSVDACLEKYDLIDKGIINGGVDSEDGVLVTLDLRSADDARLVVEDHGVGMTVDVIENYFLKVGASFRNSDAWRRSHESDGRSNIHRTGRFGVGVLASFLLGEEMTVTTRHVSAPSDEGVSFTCSRGDDSIELRPVRFRSGTRIEIRLGNRVAERLNSNHSDWDWFCLDHPKIRREILSSETKHLEQRLHVPNCSSPLGESKWRRLVAPGFDDVLWAYSPDSIHIYFPNRTDFVVCNGIRVSGVPYHVAAPRISEGFRLLSVRIPSLAVFDADGRFPLNLQRDQITSKSLPFDKELGEAISSELVSEIIKDFSDCSSGIDLRSVKTSVKPGFIGLATYSGYNPLLAPIALTKKGVLPMDLPLLCRERPRSMTVHAFNWDRKSGLWNAPEAMSTSEVFVALRFTSKSQHNRVELVRELAGISLPDRDLCRVAELLPEYGRRIVLREGEVASLVGPGKVPRTYWDSLKQEWSDGSWGVWVQGDPPPMQFDFERLSSELSATECFGFTTIYLDWDKPGYQVPSLLETPFSRAWLEAVGSAELVCNPSAERTQGLAKDSTGGADQEW